MLHIGRGNMTMTNLKRQRHTYCLLSIGNCCIKLKTIFESLHFLSRLKWTLFEVTNSCKQSIQSSKDLFKALKRISFSFFGYFSLVASIDPKRCLKSGNLSFVKRNKLQEDRSIDCGIYPIIFHEFLAKKAFTL